MSKGESKKFLLLSLIVGGVIFVIVSMIGSQLEWKCLGEDIDISGTEGNDNLLGTDGDDVIHGHGGNDFIDGKGGDDTICGGSGDDHILGGDGNDSLQGEDGKDILEGGKGNDVLQGRSSGDDSPLINKIDGGPGEDLCYSFGIDEVKSCEKNY